MVFNVIVDSKALWLTRYSILRVSSNHPLCGWYLIFYTATTFFGFVLLTYWV